MSQTDPRSPLQRPALQNLVLPQGAALLAVLLFMAFGLAACATGPTGHYSKYPTTASEYARAHAKTAGRSVSRSARQGARSYGTRALGDQALGRYKVGDPYQVGGVWYVPAEQPGYDEVGMASWYGDAFHAKSTANGELFDMTALTAAHKTLPLPSIVEVTNLGNGRRLRVRVNDRGPFVDGRILDLSRAAAHELGFAGQGLARVRVRYVGPAPLGSPADGLRMAAAEPPRRTEATPMPASQPILANPPSDPVISAASTYEVIVGAFANRDTAQGLAQSLAQRLASTGQARVQPVERDGATLYRVVVQAIAGEAQALFVRQQLLGFGLADARVVYPGLSR